MICTALSSTPTNSIRGDMPYASARNSVAKPWPYIGPWLLAPGAAMKPPSWVFARM